MITHCRKCDINWSRLWTNDSEDTAYEFCPVCATDMYLEDGTDLVAYYRCHITGNILNSETGEPYHTETKQPVRKPRKIKVWEESYDEFKDRQDKAQYDLINRYSELKSSMTDTAAYKQALDEMEKVERKFHYEEIEIF